MLQCVRVANCDRRVSDRQTIFGAGQGKGCVERHRMRQLRLRVHPFDLSPDRG